MQRAHSLEKTLVLGKIEGKRRRGWQEMARVNIDILGISELKWTGMGEFLLGAPGPGSSCLLLKLSKKQAVLSYERSLKYLHTGISGSNDTVLENVS